jgi:AcrR family transcriptional regulator
MSGSKRDRPRSGGNVERNSRTKTAIVPIYARLPKGPHGLGATGVARNQRLRLHGAMIEAVAARGYQQTSVRHVIGLAGVSRRAFYEQFSGKENCFLATFDLVVSRTIRRLTLARREATDDPARRVRVMLEVLGEELEQNPKALRLAMVDAQTAGPSGIERLHRMSALCEQQLASILGGEREAPPPPVVVVRSIVGGLRRATHTRLLEGRPEDLETLVREMSKWSLLFSSPAVALLRPQARMNDHPSPPLMTALEPEACGGQSNRARLLRSAIESRVREEKLDELSSPRIADGARLPIEAFMELFSSPEECYLEALDVLGDELLQLVADPGLVSTEWPAAVCSAVARLLTHLADSPVRLHTLGVKALEAGPPAIANVGDLLYEVATLLTEGAPRRPRTAIAIEAIAGALWQVINREALAGRAHRLPVLREYVSYVVLTPFIGPEAATEAIVGSREALGGSPTANGRASERPATPTPETTPAVNGTANGRPAANGRTTSAVNGSTNGQPAANGAPSSNGSPTPGAARNGGEPTTNGSAKVEDYRRLAERRSAKRMKTAPTSTESTITTIKGA